MFYRPFVWSCTEVVLATNRSYPSQKTSWIPAFLLVFLALTTHPISSAQASFFDTFGADARGMALGGAMAAASEGWASVHYNPAALALTRDVEFSLGFFNMVPKIEADYAWGDKEDLTQFPGRPSSLDTITGPALGLLVPVDRCTPRKLLVPVSLGIGLFVPRQALATTRVIEETYPFDVIFNERNGSLALNAALSTRITPALYLGLGMASQLVTPVETQLSETGRSAADLKVRFGAPSLVVGILVRPTERIRIGFVYRQRNRIRSRFSNFVQTRFVLPLGPNPENAIVFHNDVALVKEYVSSFTPENVSIGGAFKITERLKISAEVTWYSWSEYRGPLNFPLQKEFNDIFVPRVGIMCRITRKLEARAGFYFEPTPVVNQTAGFYPVGNDRYVPSLGLGYTFTVPWGLIEKPLSVDGYVQYHILEAKDFWQPVPLNPFLRNQDLTSEGKVLNFGFSLTFRF